MKRLTLAALTAALILTTQPAQAGWRHHECRYRGLDGNAKSWSVHEVKRTLDCATDRWNVNRSEAFYIVGRESGYRQWARNSYSGACGPMQFYPASSMVTRLRRVPHRMKPWGTSCWNARSSILAGVWEMHKYGFGAWAV